MINYSLKYPNCRHRKTLTIFQYFSFIGLLTDCFHVIETSTGTGVFGEGDKTVTGVWHAGVWGVDV